MDVVWRGECIVRGWCFGPFELQHWKYGVNRYDRRKYDRLCTSPRRHHCRPGRWRDDDRDGCEQWLHWSYWMGCWRAPSEPFSGFPVPMQQEPWLRRIYNYAPVVRVLAGLSWRQHPHRCTEDGVAGSGCWVSGFGQNESGSEPTPNTQHPLAAMETTTCSSTQALTAGKAP